MKRDFGGATIYSVYGLSGDLLHQDNLTTGVRTDYLRLGLGGDTVVSLANGVPTYQHADHLGSVVARTDPGGAVIQREVYTPFGALSLLQNERVGEEGFTGHVRDGSGVNYMKARYYMARSSRFLSPDPVGFAQGGPAYFNRYAYVGNDPVNKTDPKGEFANFVIGAGIGAVLDYGIQVSTNLAAGQSLGEAAANVDLISIGASAALGAVGGFGGARALTSAARGLNIAQKGRIGEAATRIGIAARGERVIASGRAASRVPELGSLSRQAGRARPDFVVKDAEGAVKVVESKFGSSALSAPQRALQSEVGEGAFRTSRTTYEQVGAVGAAAGGATAGLAENCASGASGPCKR